jgi:hypothetical protein
MALTYGVASGAEPVTVKVLSCYDGDTCRLGWEILPGRDRVRWLTRTPSMVAARRRSTGPLWAIEPDKYRKRIDAYVSIDGRNLGDALIAAGLARPYSGSGGHHETPPRLLSHSSLFSHPLCRKVAVVSAGAT